MSFGSDALQGAASVDAQLDANPWLQFLIEIYPDGTTQIPALKLYERYFEWCDPAGLKALNITRFGRKLKRLGAYRETLHSPISTLSKLLPSTLRRVQFFGGILLPPFDLAAVDLSKADDRFREVLVCLEDGLEPPVKSWQYDD